MMTWWAVVLGTWPGILYVCLVERAERRSLYHAVCQDVSVVRRYLCGG